MDANMNPLELATQIRLALEAKIRLLLEEGADAWRVRQAMVSATVRLGEIERNPEALEKFRNGASLIEACERRRK